MVMVVVFSTTDCGACLSEATVWEKLHRQFASRGFQVLGIGHGVDREELDAFIDALCRIEQEAREDIDELKGAPYRMPVRRLDDVRAARQLDLTWSAAPSGGRQASHSPASPARKTAQPLSERARDAVGRR